MLVQPQSLGTMFLASDKIKGSNSYTTGGVLFSAQRLALKTFAFIWPETLTESNTYFVKILRTGTGTNSGTVLVKWFVQATGAEVGAGVDLSAEYIRIAAIGN